MALLLLFIFVENFYNKFELTLPPIVLVLLFTNALITLILAEGKGNLESLWIGAQAWSIAAFF